MASRDLADADQLLAARFREIKRVFEATFPGMELRPICTYRSPEEQKAAFDAGASQIDGIHKLGNHNYHPSRAIDVGVFVTQRAGVPAPYIDDLVTAKKIPSACARALYMFVGWQAERLGLRYGGDWNGNGVPVPADDAEHFCDEGHIELKPEHA